MDGGGRGTKLGTSASVRVEGGIEISKGRIDGTIISLCSLAMVRSRFGVWVSDTCGPRGVQRKLVVFQWTSWRPREARGLPMSEGRTGIDPKEDTMKKQMTTLYC